MKRFMSIHEDVSIYDDKQRDFDKRIEGLLNNGWQIVAVDTTATPGMQFQRVTQHFYLVRDDGKDNAS